jgi:hypothetical protein
MHSWALIITARLLSGAWFAASGAAWLSGELYLQVLTLYSFYEEVVLNMALQEQIGDRPRIDSDHDNLFFGGMPNFEVQLIVSLSVFVLVLHRNNTLSAYGFTILVVLPLLMILILVWSGVSSLLNTAFAAGVGGINGTRKALLYKHILKPFLYALPPNPLFIKDKR